MTIKTLLVKISADASEFHKGLGEAETKLKTAGDNLQKMGTGLTAAVSLPLMGIGIAATKMAMDAVESENLFEVSMGGMSGAARAWSEKLRADLGLNAYEVRKSVGTFYTMFESMGMGEKKAYDMSTGLVKLAYDMASFRNMKPEEAFEKLRAGITGETEPLKRLGIIISEDTVKTFAYSTGIAAQGKELTEQEKITARYNLILQQTGKDQGDLARTIESPTNQLRVMRSTVTQLATDFGKALLPAFQAILSAGKPLIDFAGKAVQLFTSLPKPVQAIAIALGATAVSAGPILMMFGKLLTVLPALGGAFAVLTGPIGIVVAAVAGLILIGTLVVTNWTAISSWFKKLWSDISIFFAGVWAGIRAVFGGAIDAIAGVFSAFGNTVAGIATAIANAFASAFNWMKTTVSSIFKAVAEFIIDKVLWLMDQIAKIPIVRKFVQNLEEGLKAAKESIREAHEKITATAAETSTKVDAEGKKLESSYKMIGDSSKRMANEFSKAHKEAVDKIMHTTLTEYQYKKWAIEQWAIDQKKALEEEKVSVAERNASITAIEQAKVAQLKELAKEEAKDRIEKETVMFQERLKLRMDFEAKVKAANEAYEAEASKLTDSIKKLTLSELDYKTWALGEERKQQETHIKNMAITEEQKNKLLLLLDQEYASKKKEILDASYADWKALVESTTEVISGVFGNFLKNTLDAFQIWGEGGGKILKNFGEVFKRMVNDAIDGIKRLVIEVMMAAVKTKVAKLAEALASVIASVMKSIPFPLNLALVGVAIAAVSALFSAIKLGEGGLVWGPTPALIGEKGPELVLPLERVKAMGLMGGATVRQYNYFYGDIKSDRDFDEISRRLADRTIQAIQRGRKAT